MKTPLLALVVCLALGSFGLLPSITSPAQARFPERHPRIHAAIRELREAKRELEKADHDFEGHRVDVIKAVDHAIEQLEVALKHDKT